MKTNSFAPWFYVGFGIFLGYFGSMFLFISWMLSPLLGFIFRESITGAQKNYRYRHSFPAMKIISFLCIGILIGGIPACSIMASYFEGIYKMLVFIANPALFFIGAIIKDVFRWIKNLKFSNNVSITI